MLPKIEKKIQSIEEIYSILEEISPECHKKFLTDKIYRGALFHYLYLIADSCIALAEMIIRYKKIPRADSYFESIDVLGEFGIIPANFAYKFASIASFRNFLAHHYEKVDYYIVCEKILNRLPEVRVYLDEVKKNLGL